MGSPVDNIRTLPRRLKSVTSDLVKEQVQMSHVPCLAPHMMPQYVCPTPYPQTSKVEDIHSIAYRKLCFLKNKCMDYILAVYVFGINLLR